MNLVALGKAAINITSGFASYDQYKIYNIGLKSDGDDIFLQLMERGTPEGYEKLPSSAAKKLRSIKGETMMVVCGTSTVATASLVILEQLVKSAPTVSVVYVKPDVEFASENERAQERVVRCVLQEYSRSMLLKELIILDNNIMDRVAGPGPISNLHERVNDQIVRVIHLYNVYNNTRPVFGEMSNTPEINRILTFGITNLEDVEIKTLYNLKEITDVRYYFGVNKDKLTDPNLKYEIVDFIRRSKKSNCSGYSVFENFGPENFGILTFYSSEPESS
tara:strand:- start:320 stop:1150 length:831 start_codon:yes stop_codon:yes gene_type:complete